MPRFMHYELNSTHDPKLQSWVASANDPMTDFPIQNLPFCVFKKEDQAPRIGVGIGDFVLDLNFAVELFNLDRELADQCKGATIDALLNLNVEARAQLRSGLSKFLSQSNQSITQHEIIVEHLLFRQSEVEFLMPATIRNYTDFYCSIFHATNIGSMFRPDNPLLPNYKHLPIGYHGRASSVVISDTKIKRPSGQTNPNDEAMPMFGKSKMLDYELEIGAFVAQGNALGEPVNIEDAERYLFGLCLVNDWSARDMQRWEYQPLGPFLAKSFATSISPFVVTMEALAPFRVPAFLREADDPPPLPYLSSEETQKLGGVALNLEVFITSQKMREAKMPPMKLSHGNAHDLYWTMSQMLTHHASNGCNLQSGDLIASGTISGATKDSRGSLMELTWRGTQPLQLLTGEVRKFLENGDEVVMKGFCEREGFRRIGFGACRGMIIE